MFHLLNVYSTCQTVDEALVGDASSVSHPKHLMTVITSVTITTAGCSATCTVVCPHKITRMHLKWEREAAPWWCSWSWRASVGALGGSAPAAAPQSSLTSSSCLVKNRDKKHGEMTFNESLRWVWLDPSSWVWVGGRKCFVTLNLTQLVQWLTDTFKRRSFMNHWARTMSEPVVCEEALASDFPQHIKSQHSENVINPMLWW